MKIKAGQSKLETPPIGLVSHVTYTPAGGCHYGLQHSSSFPPEKKRGIPYLYNLNFENGKSILRVSPKPDKDGELIISYYPPLMLA